MKSDDVFPAQTDLDKKIEEFRWVFPWGTTLIEALRRDGADISHARASGKEHVWFLRVRLPGELQEAFGTAPEILVVVVKGEVQARDFERARAELYRSSFRLDLDLLVICDDHSDDLEERLQRMPGRWGQWVPWPASREQMPSLGDQFRRYLPRLDIFEETNPVRGRSVIGRDEDIADLTRRVQKSESVGIFGLRRVGKTSVVRAVTDSLDPISARLSTRARHADPLDVDSDEVRAIVCWLDVQRVYDRSPKRLLLALCDSISSRLALHGLCRRDQLGDPLEHIDDLLRQCFENTSLQLCIVLDEYDLLFEGSDGQPSIPGVAELFRLLRGWAQETERLSLIVIGRDPSPFQSPEIGGFPNPMLGWFVTRWIGPLTPDHAMELLVRLGKRVGLSVGPETSHLALELTGGHPSLHRQYGSALLESIAQKGEVVWGSATDPFCRAAALTFHERSTVRSICREILFLLRKRFKSSYDRLVQAARSSPLEVLRHASWNSPAVTILRHYGLFFGSPTDAFMPGALTYYIRGNEYYEDRQGRRPTRRNARGPEWRERRARAASNLSRRGS